MGQRLTSLTGTFSSGEAVLIAPSMNGDIEQVKHIIGTHIADNDAAPTSSNEHSHRPQHSAILTSFVNRTDPSGNAAIHGAVFGGHLELVKFLVESCGANITSKNVLGCSPLWLAAGYNHLECLKYLVEKISSLDEPDSDSVAEEKKESERMSLESALLDVNSSGDTPFLAAASKNNIEICKYLMKSIGGSGNEVLLLRRKMLRTANNAGDTALSVAVSAGHGDELLTLLLDLDEETSKSTNNDKSLDESMQLKCIDKKNKLGLSPLIVSCERNQPSITEKLLKYGADISVCDDKGRNALSVAAFCGCDDAVQFLLAYLEKLQSLSSFINETDSMGCTPLFLAARTGNVKMVKLLVDAGADSTKKNDEGLTPHDVAVKYKKEGVEKYFSDNSIS